MAGAGAKTFVNNKLKQIKILLFSKTDSAECKQVKDILDEYKMKHPTYENVEIEMRQDCNQIETYFQILCLTDRREVPQLFVDGTYIGGEQKIKRMHADGTLKTLLSDAKAL